MAGDIRKEVGDGDHNLRNDVRQSIQEVSEKMVSLESRSEMQIEDAGRKMGALDLRMSGVQGAITEHKRDIQRHRTENNEHQSRLDRHDGELSSTTNSMD